LLRSKALLHGRFLLYGTPRSGTPRTASEWRIPGGHVKLWGGV